MTGVAIAIMVLGLIIEYGQVIFYINNQMKNDAKQAKQG
jgi:hypothetical protein